MKRFVKKKIWLRALAFMLFFAIAFNVAYKEGMFKVNANEEVEKSEVDEITEEDLQSMDVEVMEDGSIKTVVLRKDGIKVVSISNENSIVVITYDAEGNIIAEEVTDFTELSGDISDEELEDTLDEECDEDILDEEDDVSRGGKTKWNKAVKETYKDNYWYKKGSNGKKVYLRVGCKAKYQIRLDNYHQRKEIFVKNI